MGTAKAWKIAKGKYSYITSRGTRGIKKTLAAAKKAAGISISKKKASSSRPKRKGGSVAKKKTTSKRGSRIIGNLGLKGLVASGVVLSGLKYVVRRFVPQAGAYTTAIAGLGTGAVGHVVGLPTKSVAQFGAVDGISELIYDLISPGGLVTFPSIEQVQAPAGYDV